MSTAAASYKGHRYPVEIINHCVWLYFRLPLSFREVEELMLARGVVVSYETIRRWCVKFRQAYANQLRRRRPRPGDKWHLDEVFVKINGITHYLWRAVDQHGTVLDVLVQSRRNAKAAKRFFRKLLKGLRYVPRVLVTDKLASYGGSPPRVDGVGATPPVAVSEQSRRELSSAHPTARTSDETLQVIAACPTVPVGFQRYLRTLSTTTTSAQRNRLAKRDGRPLRGLARGHRTRQRRLKYERWRVGGWRGGKS